MLAVVASRRNAPAVAVMALAAPLAGVTTGLATGGVDAVVWWWWCVPAIVLAALELMLAVATTDPWRTVTRPIADGVAATGSVIALVLPATAAVEHHLSGNVPTLLATMSLAMTAVRTNRPISRTVRENGHKRVAFDEQFAGTTIGALSVAGSGRC